MTHSEFNFFQHWYPLIPVEDLNPKRPTPITVLGLNLVIWQPGLSSTYRVFMDRCPHRLAPLSEGRIDEKTGNLMCSYHGWQFDAEGICTRIPQAEDPNIIDKNKDDFCVTALPCRQANDLLWVWLDVHSKELADTTPLPLSSLIDAEKGFVWSSYMRDLEYDWQTLVENVADPSHVPFSHHGIQGNRESATPVPINIERSTPDLITAYVLRNFKTTMLFKPPCQLEYCINLGGEKQLGLVTYCIPVSPGKSRLIAQFSRNFAKFFHYLTPRWFSHLKVRNQIIDGDMILLSIQESLLNKEKAFSSWKDVYKMPTQADRFVIEFRKWFDRYCQGSLPWQEVGENAELIKVNLSREQILDRYQQHTLHCSSCRGALKNIQLLQKILLGNFAVTVSVVALMPDTIRLKFGLPLIIVALLGLTTYGWLKFWLKPRFYFVDYIHAER
ncbi:MAG: Rieske 2Fe-2S domain-containing protein [Waterburya sp.]